MTYDTAQELQKELSPGESLLWSGRPRQGFLLRGSDAVTIPVSLFWCGFAIFWTYEAYTASRAPFALFVGIPFVVAGIYLVCGRFFVDLWMRSGTYYGVTDERILILSEKPTYTLKSLDLETMSEVSLSEKSHDAGIITFQRHSRKSLWGAGVLMPGGGQYRNPQFEYINNASSVFEIIRDARKQA